MFSVSLFVFLFPFVILLHFLNFFLPKSPDKSLILGPKININTITTSMENIETGLMLMVVGMITVFLILLIVIYVGKGLILLVNKVAPEEAPKKAPTVAPTADAGAMDAIKAAVDILTAGKGQVIKIEKL
jgi:oxaloacetate decarboxylase gamma subunit